MKSSMTLGMNLGVLQTTKTMTIMTDARVYFASRFFSSCSFTPPTRRRLLAAAAAAAAAVAADDELPQDIVLLPFFTSLDFCFIHRDVIDDVALGAVSKAPSRD